MKKIIFTAAAVLILASSFAQKCKFDYDKKDPMTGKMHKGIIVRLLYNPLMDRQWHLTLEKIGDDYFLANDLVLEGHIDDILQKGDSLMLKMESGKIITCYARSSMTPKKSGSGTSSQKPISEFIGIYPISEDQFKYLKNEKCSYIQINIGPLVYNYEIKDKTSIKLKESANCILDAQLP